MWLTGLLMREGELLSALEERGTQDSASVDEYAREVPPTI